MHLRIPGAFCLIVMLAVSVSTLYAQGPAPSAETSVFVPLIVKLGGGSSGGGAVHTGEATYYNEADGGGNCSFDRTPQDLMVGAMNQTDYANAAICGAYVELTGPNGTITIRIVDRCPECPAGNIDLSPLAFSKIAELVDGRVPISWRIVSPDIDGPIRYQFKEGSSQWWTAVQIRNHRNPVAKLEFLDTNGQFVAMERQEWNYFLPPGSNQGLGPGPYTFRVTDSYGNVLTDTGIALNVAGEIAGGGQFPKMP
ncbi:MAG TPA: expansin EXLX1 family cellulose-binding protein [Roseiflexaceae bacterium]|nr:expansin EXLX1 family cellulose-binding protein [Roseiflexaceae bacterium]